MNSKLYSTSKSDTKLQKSNLRSQTQSNSNHRITKIFFFRLLFEFSLLDSCKSTLKILTSLAKAVVMILMVHCYLQRFGNISFQFQGGGGGGPHLACLPRPARRPQQTVWYGAWTQVWCTRHQADSDTSQLWPNCFSLIQ